MNRQLITILFVDDDVDEHLLFKEDLKEIQTQRFEVTSAMSYKEALEKLRSQRFDVCFFDHGLGAHNAFDLMTAMREMRLDTPVIILTNRTDIETDTAAMKLGVMDYLVKGRFSPELLGRSIRYAIERATSMRELRASKERYQGLFQSSIDAICLLDAEGRFTDANRMAQNLFGYSREAFLQKNLTDLFENDEDKVLFVNRIFKRENIRDFEASMLTTAGERLYFIISCTCFGAQEGQENIFFQVILHDITRRKKMEHDLLVAENLAATGRFVRMLGHEIRNPLTNIDLSIEQLELENKDEELNEYLAIIKRNSKRIGRLLTDLLQSANPGRLKFERCQPHELLDQTLDLAADRIALKNIEVHKDYQTTGVPIQADPEKLKIALLNIVLNAVEIMETGKGVLHLSTRCQDGDCILSIRDNGPGIAKENRGRIFEPYFSRKTNGMGLGLAGSLTITQLHHGRIEVQSEPGQGAEFKLHFPVEGD